MKIFYKLRSLNPLNRFFVKFKKIRQPKVISTNQGLFYLSNQNETIQKSLLFKGSFEYHLVKIAIELAKIKTGIIVDVGANIGSFAIPLALKYPSRDIVSFEPQRTVFYHLAANIFLNNLSNVIAHRLVISDEKKEHTTVPFFDLYENYSGSVTLSKDIANKRSKIPGVAEPLSYAKKFDLVKITSLDKFFTSKISLIKIDVEGMELSVLKSAESILKQDSPILLFETWDLPEFEKENKSIIKYLSSVGYVCFSLGNDSVACRKDDVEGIKAIKEVLK